MAKVLMLTGDSLEQAWELLGDEAGLYGDNGGEPDGNVWLPSDEVDTEAAQRVIDAGLGRMVEARYFDGDDAFAKLFGFMPDGEDDEASEEELAQFADTLKGLAQDLPGGWAHYGAYGAGDSKWVILKQEQSIGAALTQAEPVRTIVMPINPTIRREIAEKVVEQAHPGYSYPYQGQWYTDGQRLYHVEEHAPWMPWSDDAVVVSVDDLVFEYGGADDSCDFSPVDERDGSDITEAAIDFCLAYVPSQIEIAC